jgi:hypothetical protein
MSQRSPVELPLCPFCNQLCQLVGAGATAAMFRGQLHMETAPRVLSCWNYEEGAGGPAFKFLDASATTNQGAPSLRPLQGWEPPTYQLEGLRSVLPTLSHRTRKDGAPSTGDTVHKNQQGRGKPGPPGLKTLNPQPPSGSSKPLARPGRNRHTAGYGSAAESGIGKRG